MKDVLFAWVVRLFLAVLSIFVFVFLVLLVASPGGHDLVAYPPCLRVGVGLWPLTSIHI